MVEEEVSEGPVVLGWVREGGRGAGWLADCGRLWLVAGVGAPSFRPRRARKLRREMQTVADTRPR